jgi:hypothetical protein
VWGLFKENIPLARLIDSSETLCWSAKWYGKKEVLYSSIFEDKPINMVKKIHALLDEADMVVHYYGTKFDIPTLNKEFLLYGLQPPAPYKQVDLCTVVRSRFKFASNKLDYIAQKLGLGKKHTTDFQLWVDCMNKDAKAWKKMKAYNIQDVLLLEKVYDRIKGWIKGHSNISVFAGKLVCPNCGSSKCTRRGFSYTSTQKYQRLQCGSCGNWFRTGKTLGRPPAEKGVNI